MDLRAYPFNRLLTIVKSQRDSHWFRLDRVPLLELLGVDHRAMDGFYVAAEGPAYCADTMHLVPVVIDS